LVSFVIAKIIVFFSFICDQNLSTQTLRNYCERTVFNALPQLELVGAGVVQVNDYPGWEPNMESPLLAIMLIKHEQVLAYKPEVKVIHAGLKCGILGATYPNWDMISFGPTIRGAHSPDEKAHIPAVASFWTYLKAALADIPELKAKKSPYCYGLKYRSEDDKSCYQFRKISSLSATIF
jgi:di/tripeptidase